VRVCDRHGVFPVHGPTLVPIRCSGPKIVAKGNSVNTFTNGTHSTGMLALGLL